MIQINYNPDVLTCLANLSNDEVFTPPQVVNQMLDLLPKKLWHNPDARFLDPVSKSGVFLREITRRLNTGLEKQIPDTQQRINHILTKQVFGIAITELTSLLSRRSAYCSKIANGKYSICDNFTDEQGNIIYARVEHAWVGGKCKYCGASQEVYDRGGELETHAYQFIHTDKPEEIFKNMKFDVIIGNPPYQLEDEGFGRSAAPIYHKFIQQSKKLNPRYLTMIVPSRWFAGGKGLDEFREEMLTDDRIRKIVDYIEANDCFSGIQLKGGVCYFLWDRDNKGDCEVTSIKSNQIISVATRPLLEIGNSTFIRFNEAIPILSKVRTFEESSIQPQISARKPFGLATTFRGEKKSNELSDVKLYQNGGVGYVSKDRITSNIEMLPKFKVLIPPLGSGSDSFPHQILGKAFVAEPNSICTETYLVAGVFDDEIQAQNLVSYLSTRFLRFLVLLNKPTQHATSKVYQLVPMQDFSESWTDEKLYAKYGLTKDEIAFIESMIRPMDINK